MKIKIILGLFLFGLIAAGRGESMEDLHKALKSLLPAEAGGWKAAAPDHFYDPQTIFDYIDGAGEVYRAYNFRLLLSRRYQREGEADLVADLFDMGWSADAFGVFTHDLEGEEPGVGQGSTYNGGLLSFWRDRYFVSLYAEKESDEAKGALLALGRAVALAVGRDGQKPGLLTLLPEDFRDPRAVRYFHTYPILNYHFFISPDNILNLGAETEVVLAARPVGSPEAGATAKEYILLVRYLKPEDAAKALASFSKSYMLQAAAEQGPEQASRIAKTEDGRWTAAGIKRNVAVIVFQAPSAEEARRILQRAVLGLEK